MLAVDRTFARAGTMRSGSRTLADQTLAFTRGGWKQQSQADVSTEGAARREPYPVRVDDEYGSS